MPIFAVVLGDNAKTVRWSNELMSRGFWLHPIRPPTVAVGSSRLRIAVSAAHSDEEINSLASALKELAEQDQGEGSG